jgi:hypothetical protein
MTLWVLAVPVTASAAEDGAEPAGSEARIEWAVFPELSYDSDIGMGFGVLGNIARVREGVDPWLWKVQAQAYVTLGKGPDDKLVVNYTNDYLDFDFPVLAGGRVRLTGRAAFRRQINTPWYGVGNATASTPERAGGQYHVVDHIYPGVRADAWIQLPHGLALVAGGRFLLNWIRAPEGSLLEAQADELVGAGRHQLLQVQGGLLIDNRDRELAPQHGVFAELTLRGGAVLEDATGYGGLNATFRGYEAIIPDHLIVAGRAMVDVLVGDPPFYELARFAGTRPDEMWGSWGIRGIGMRRFAGKVRLLGNLELRGRFVTFNLAKRPFTIGALAFVDAGRVWAELTPHPELDGTGVGLHVAGGAGLRLIWGEAFVVRADFGWSAEGSGIYVDVSHIF